MPDPTPPSVPRVLLDTNAILRYLLNDVVAQAEIVEEKILQARAGRLVLEIHPLVVSEVVFVLESFYREPKDKILLILGQFLYTPGLRVHEGTRVRNALARYADKNVSFVDAYLSAIGVETKLPIFSFDRGLDKFKDIRRIEK